MVLLPMYWKTVATDRSMTTQNGAGHFDFVGFFSITLKLCWFFLVGLTYLNLGSIDFFIIVVDIDIVRSCYVTK